MFYILLTNSVAHFDDFSAVAFSTLILLVGL